MASVFTDAVCSLLSSVPEGKVVTYGSLAAAAGSPRAARQVVRILHSQSRLRNLPWHRVVASDGRIAIKDLSGADLQAGLLRTEGVEIGENGKVDLGVYAWHFSQVDPH
ncbi:MAG: MGMT family protein [Spirochaetaceae bacterium]|nr:MGMT family protein [Spirochaetaceae bacterium]MDT8297525.1 MGMT family protein [Spirochaetaceae bacterium]